MLLKVLWICVALSNYFAAIQTQKIEKVSVTVYYESVCVDSRKFFTSQLYPTLVSNLGEWLNLTLVPYGLTSESVVDDQVRFNCHHGAYECYGNKLHACAINNIPPNSNIEYGFNNVTIGAINCLMDKVSETMEDGEKVYHFPIEYCSTVNHVPDYVQSIENCVGHSQGNEYLSAMGNLTRALEPTLKSVPTIIIDGHTQAARGDFKQALCDSLKTNEKPAECKNKTPALKSVPAVTFDGQNKSKVAQEDLCFNLTTVEQPAECKNKTFDDQDKSQAAQGDSSASTLFVSTSVLTIILFKQLFFKLIENLN